LLRRERENNLNFLLKMEAIFVIIFTEINGYYVIPIMSGIGFLLNLLCFIVFMSSRFRLKSKLKYLIAKLFLDMLFCLIGIGFQNDLCIQNCTLNCSLFFQIFRLYAFKFTSNLLYVSIGFISICLTYDRYLILLNKKNWLNKTKNFKYIVFGCLCFSLILCVPDLFARIIVPANGTGLFYIKLTEFGQTNAHSYYSLAVVVVVSLIQIVLMFSASSMLVVEFRKFVKNKSNLSNQMYFLNQNLVLLFQNSQKAKQKKAEINFIRMTLILSALDMFMRFINLITMVFQKITYLSKTFDTEFILYLSNACILIIYSVQSFNFLVLFYYYKRFRKAFRNLCSKEII